MQRYFGLYAAGLLFLAGAVFNFLPQAEEGSSAQTIGQAKGQSSNGQVDIQPDGPAWDEKTGFYVLSLSWSPTYCKGKDAGRSKDQCGTGKRFGWIVHGLWPQFDKGYPENCPSAFGSRVPPELGRSMMDIMPDMGLIGHQWRKHGTCTGLDMADYFSLVRKAHQRIIFPAELTDMSVQMRSTPEAVETLFQTANPGLEPAAMAVTCEDELLDEVRICMDASLSFRPCREVDSRSCRRSDISIPPLP